jgi:Type IV secretion-system coupling protein DNA-binding domain
MIVAPVLVDVAAVIVAGTLGAVCSWAMRRYSTLSVRNTYPPAIVSAGGLALALWLKAWPLVIVTAPVTSFCLSAALCGRRWRLADLGAGEELRAHERERRWIWQPAPVRRPGERIYLRSQGELVHRRPWPKHVHYVPMSENQAAGSRLPLGEGQHIFACGATGSGKTTTMRRVLVARTLTEEAALLILDQKGDQEDVEQMSRLAATAGVPFVLIDPQDPNSDRYQPLWGTPAQVAARAVEPIKQSEPYYYDVLRLHLDTVCRVLHAADRWPPSIPFLIDACHPLHYPALQAIAHGLGDHHRQLARRVEEHGRYVVSRKGNEDLSGGSARLQVALALANRDWLAKLMGTRALWQSTDQTSGHGTQHSGRGSARRVREFRIGSDTFAELGQGEAVIYTTLGPDPQRANVIPVALEDRAPERIGTGNRHPCELLVHPEHSLPPIVYAATDNPRLGEADPGSADL